VTDRVRGGRLDLAIEIDGHLDARARRSRPAGVTGIFYLHPESAPLAEKPVTELFAATDINVLTPVTVGQPARFTYLEARFTIPVDAPSGRLFLRSPNASLNVLVINNFVVLVPGSMDRLDISKLVRREGVNTVRWLPGGSTGDRGGWPIFPRADVLLNRAVPSLHLAWWK
jgi:hypothetical protein